MDNIDLAKLEAALDQLQAEKERRLQARVDAGELVPVPLSVAVPYESEIPDAVEQAKASKLKELRAGGEVRAVQFDVMVVVTGVCRLGGGEEWKPAPAPLPAPARQDEDEKEVREDARPPVVESYVYTTIRPASDDGDAGAILEGWYSIDDGQLVLTDREGQHITSRAMIAGEDPAALAKALLREAKGPSDFNRRLDYPTLGIV